MTGQSLSIGLDSQTSGACCEEEKSRRILNSQDRPDAELYLEGQSPT